MKEFKSPLIYPGSKGSVIHELLPLFPDNFLEYREPFMGSCSIFLAVKQKYGDNKKYWINDLNYELYNFFLMCQKDAGSVVEQILKWRNEYIDKHNGGKVLFYELKRNLNIFSDIELAAAYYILNRSAFSGGSLVSGFSKDHFEHTFTEERIKNLHQLKSLLKDVRITNLDYELLVKSPVINNDNEDVFLMCCIPGTKIRMKNEKLLNIEDVKIGDMTFLGDDVTNSIYRQYNGNIYEFEVMGIYYNLCVTEEHPLAIIRQNNVYSHLKYFPDGNLRESKFKHQDILDKLNIQFIRSKDINVGDFLLIPCYPESIINVKTVNIGEVDVPCNYELGWVCGFWLAEANINRYYGKDIIAKPSRIKEIENGKQSTLEFFDESFEISEDNIVTEMENIALVKEKSRFDSCYSITFVCGENDLLYGFLTRLDEWFGKYFGIKGHLYHYPDSHSYQINYYNEDISKFMYHKFGEYAKNKYIDNDFLNYPLEFQKGLLQGWLDGDGGNYVDKRNRTKITGTTMSKQLALGMYSIALRLGLKPMMKFRGDIIWDVYFSSDDAIILSSNSSDKYSIPNKKYGDRSKRRIIKKGNMRFILSPITDININRYNGPVYNLTTKKHIYVANYVLNHNCDPPYAAATDSGLYGKGGNKWRNLHKSFDHYRFANVMKECKYNWLVTYDDSPFIRGLFSFANQKSWSFTHRMRKDRIGKELLISNFSLKDEVKTIQADIESAWG